MGLTWLRVRSIHESHNSRVSSIYSTHFHYSVPCFFTHTVRVLAAIFFQCPSLREPKKKTHIMYKMLQNETRMRNLRTSVIISCVLATQIAAKLGPEIQIAAYVSHSARSMHGRWMHDGWRLDYSCCRTAGGIAGVDLVVGRLGRASVERRGVQPNVQQQE